MTVGELIALLQAFPAGTRVIVDGYETGLDDVGIVASGQIIADMREDGHYDGVHDAVVGPHIPGRPTETAVLISRFDEAPKEWR